MKAALILYSSLASKKDATMPDKTVLKDIMFSDEPIGLADQFQIMSEPFGACVLVEEEVACGQQVYFGVDLPIGDIAEVQARVVSCDKSDVGYTVEIEVLAVDDRFPSIVVKTLKGEAETATAGDGLIQWAVGLKQTNGLYATLVNSPAGVLTTRQLEKITELTRTGAGLAKLTHAQRVILLLKPEQTETVAQELSEVGLRFGVLHSGVRNIRGCCGALCSFAQGTDALGLSIEIDKAIFGREMKFDVKIAVSDCLRNCMECFCVDIGLIAESGKYEVYVGGMASSGHYKGLKLLGGVEQQEAVSLIVKILDWYDSVALRGERMYKTLERLGAEDALQSDQSAFESANKLFDGLATGMDVEAFLSRSYAKAHGVKKMRKDLGLG